MDMVAGADDEIAVEAIDPLNNVPNHRQGDWGPVVEIREVHGAEPRERRREVRHRDPVVVGEDKVAFRNGRVPGWPPSVLPFQPDAICAMVLLMTWEVEYFLLPPLLPPLGGILGKSAGF
jgi:hypothetical protein